MAAAAFIRGLSRNCLRAGSNGLCRPTVLSPGICRAFAVVPFRIAESNSATLQPTHTAPAGELLSRPALPHPRLVRHSSSGDHVKLWTAERAVSVILLGAIPAAIMMPTAPVETFMALSLTLHSHWGIEALVHDYVRPSVFGAVVPRLAVAAVYALSVMTFTGLCYFIYTDIGLINAVSMFWKL